MNNQTITLYNYHKNADKSESYRRTVIHGVNYSFSNTKTVDSTGKVSYVPTLTVIIPQNAPQATYIDAKGYAKLTDTTGYFTFNTAGNKDVIVCGEVTREITSTYTVTNLQADYLKIGKIQAFSDNTDAPRLKHYKVVC
jgi:hypothetical protein